MKRLLILGAFVAGILALAVVAVPMLVSGERFRPILESQIGKALGRPVKIGSCSLRLLPPAVDADHISIAEDPRFTHARPFAEAKQLRVRARLVPLLKGQVDIASLTVTQPNVELIQSRDGRWNAASLGGGGGGPGGTVALGRISIVDGTVAVTTSGGGRTVYEHVDLSVGDIAAGSRMPIDLALRIGPKQSIEFHGSARAGGGVTEAQGRIEWKNPEVGTKKLSYAIASEFDAQYTGGVMRISRLHATVGSLAVRITGSVDNRTAKPTLALDVDVPSASITELAQLAAGFGVAFSPDYRVKGTMAAKVAVRGTAAEPALSGTVDVADLEISGGEIKDPVRMSALKLDLTPEAIRSRPFQVQSGPTRLNGYLSVAGYAKSPRLEAAVFADNSDLGDLVRMAQAYGVTAAQGMSASGRTSVHIRVHGPMKRGSPLSYSGTVALEAAEIRLASLTKPVAVEKAGVKFEADSAVVDQAAIRVGNSNLQGTLRVRDFAHPDLQLAIRIDRLNASELRGLVKPGPGGAPSGTARVTARGNVAIGNLNLEPLVLTDVRSGFTFEKGILNLDPLTAGTYNGQLTGSITVDTNADPVRYTARTKLQKVDAEGLLAAATPLRKVLTGAMSGDTQLSFAPKPGEDLARSLRGTLSLRLAEGKFLPISLLGEVGTIAQFLNKKLPAVGGVTPFLGLSGDFNIENGTASTENLRLDLDAGSVQAAGAMNLADQTLNMKLITTLSRQFSEQAGGSRIGGYLSSAVSNAKGELLIPLLLSGSFSRPQLAPDLVTMGKLKLQHAMPGLTGSPGSVIDAITGNKEGVRSILDSLRTKKKDVK
jgi:uncharacterized protein involved in outer membrane biogenesis